MDKFHGDVDKLMQWARREYDDALASRNEYDALLTEWSRQYEAKPLVDVREIPWEGASNLEVPEAASHTDTVFSRIEEAWFGTTPWAKVNYYDTRLKEGALAFQDLLNYVTLPKANYRIETPHVLLGMTKFGTSFQWCSFMNEKYRYWRNGKLQRRTVHVGPIHKYLSARQVITPPDARDEQTCRWIGIRSFFTWGELSHFADQQTFVKSQVDKISGKGQTINTAAAKEGERESGINRSGQLLQWEIVQMFARYYNPRVNELEEVWITFDYPSYTLLQAEYIPYDHMMRPITRYTYMIREGAFAGIGIIGMMSAIQEEISTIHNYTLDAMLFSNSPMIKGPKNFQGSVKVHPGAYLPYTNRGDEWDVFQAGMVHQSAYQSEMSSRGIGERRTGVSDASLQRAGTNTQVRAPVGTTVALLGESNRRFAMSIALGKETEARLLKQHMLLIRQYWPLMKDMVYGWNPEKASKIESLFALSDDAFLQDIVVELAMSTATINREVEKQNVIMLSQFMKEYYSTFLGLTMQLQQAPQIEKEIRAVLASATEIATQVLQTFDIRNIKELIPDADASTTPTNNTTDTSSIVDELTAQFLNDARTGTAELGADSALVGTPDDTGEVSFIE